MEMLEKEPPGLRAVGGSRWFKWHYLHTIHQAHGLKWLSLDSFLISRSVTVSPTSYLQERAHFSHFLVEMLYLFSSHLLFQDLAQGWFQYKGSVALSLGGQGQGIPCGGSRIGLPSQETE